MNKLSPKGKTAHGPYKKWSLFGGYFVLFYQGRVIEVLPLFTGWSLIGCGLYLEVIFNTGLNVLLKIRRVGNQAF